MKDELTDLRKTRARDYMDEFLADPNNRRIFREECAKMDAEDALRATPGRVLAARIRRHTRRERLWLALAGVALLYALASCQAPSRPAPPAPAPIVYAPDAGPDPAAMLALRMTAMLAQLDPRLPAPHVTASLRTLAAIILAEHGDVDPLLLAALGAVESRYRSGRRGREGERGVYQIKPEVAAELGCQSGWDRSDLAATRCAVRVLDWLHARCGGEWSRVVGAWNGSPCRITTDYAARVLRLAGAP